MGDHLSTSIISYTLLALVAVGAYKLFLGSSKAATGEANLLTEEDFEGSGDKKGAAAAKKKKKVRKQPVLKKQPVAEEEVKVVEEASSSSSSKPIAPRRRRAPPVKKDEDAAFWACEGFEEGERVEAVWPETGGWFRGTVSGVKSMGAGEKLYAVEFDDGEKATKLAVSQLRKLNEKKQETQKKTAPLIAAPDVDGLVAYRKEGAAVLPKPVEEEYHEEYDDGDESDDESDDSSEDDDDLDVSVVRSEAEWKMAAAKPRKPRVGPRKPRATPVEKAAKADDAKRALVNRKKKEKAKEKKIIMREIMRKAL